MTKFKKNTIQMKLIILFTIIAAVLFLTVGFLFFKSTKSAINKSKGNELTILSQETANKIERFIFERTGDLQVMATSPLLKNTGIARKLKLDYLENVRSAYKTYDYIFITDAKGNIDVLSGNLNGDTEYKRWISEVLNGKFYESDFIHSETNQNYYVYFSAPITDYNGKILGTVVERMNFNAIMDILRNVHFGKLGHAYLSDGKGNIISYSNTLVKRIKNDSEKQNDAYISSKDGEKFLCSTTSLVMNQKQNSNWYLVVEEPAKEAFEVTDKLRNYTVIVMAICFSFLSAVTVISSKIITNPIRKLVMETKSIAAGDRKDKINIAGSDEVGSLANSFNSILLNLDDMMKQVLELSGEAAALSEVRQYADKFFESMQNALIIIDSSGRISTINKEAANLIGLRDDDIIGRHAFEIGNSRLAPIINILMDGLEEGKIYIKHIININTEPKIPIMINTSIQKDSSGNILGVIGVFKAVEEIRKFEESVIRAKSLESLGALSAGMAHEIRNPLTSIKGYAQYIKSELIDNSDLSIDIEIIIREVDRLNNIIDRFLAFARPQKLKLEQWDINEIICEVLKLIKLEAEGNKININKNLCSMKLLYVDYEQIGQVLLNILLNSVQAMPYGGELNIYTLYIDNLKLVEIGIEDNGVGISPDNYEKIFEPFFTTKEKGTGLGLAICSRIIESHHGFIEVSSTLGKGTKFIIRLPAAGNER